MEIIRRTSSRSRRNLSVLFHRPPVLKREQRSLSCS
ncbi:MAG: hypothetical protein QOH71_259 [Blastocatellia bacterium]|jgi:hypothetical protein|nr:hypothetical protein [Blastocatellia bacterium]